jgi:hypothetical protein
MIQLFIIQPDDVKESMPDNLLFDKNENGFEIIEIKGDNVDVGGSVPFKSAPLISTKYRQSSISPRAAARRRSCERLG